MDRVKEVAYKGYYLIYYILIAYWMIKHPIRVEPPQTAIPCRFYCDPGYKGVRHHNFLLVPIAKENRLLFFKRKFAFSRNGECWYLLPSLTPRGTDPDGHQRYGLNSEIARNYVDIDPDNPYPTYFMTRR